MKQDNPFEVKRIRDVAVMVLLVICMGGLATADNYVGGLPLTTVQSGTVSGDLYVDVNNTWWSGTPGPQDVEKTFAAIPDVSDIEWARLYVAVYDGHMQNNYRGNATVSFDGNGDGTYETILGTENLDVAYTFPHNGGSGPVTVNDHCNRVTSDYLMWYDVTSLITSQTPKAHVVTAAVDPSFDGRIKVITLVVAYNDGDTDTIRYLVNQGHDTVTYYDTSGYTGDTVFDLSGLAGTMQSATLTVNHMASSDGLYTWNGDPIDRLPDGDTDPAGSSSQGAYFGWDIWDMTSRVNPGEAPDFSYDRSGMGQGEFSGQFYKIPLAVLGVRYLAVPPTADFSADPLSGTTPLNVQFTDLSTNTPAAWNWEYRYRPSGGSWSNYVEFNNTQNPLYAFTDAGDYIIRLTATNSGGSGSKTRGTTTVPYITVSPAEEVNLTITNVNPVTATLFAREPNTVRITIRNNGAETSTPAEVELSSSDGFEGTATVPSLAPGTQNITSIVDTTVRPLAGDSITYNATVGNSSRTATKVVTYNGYKGKRYWEGGSDVTTKRTIDLRGGFLISPGDSHYVSGGVGGSSWNSYILNWTGADLPVPEGATLREAWLYVPYTWDNSGQVPDHFHLAFNGQPLSYDALYQDMSNFGAYYNYYYGLLTYNVTPLFSLSGNNATVGKDDADSTLSMYGLTLGVVYEKTGEPRRQIFMNEEFDILGADGTGYATTPEEATAYVPFSGMTVVPADVSGAELITFVPSGNMHEGDLLFNGDTIATNVWDYGDASGTQVAVDVRDVKAYLQATGNEAGIRSTAGATPLMAASHEFLVVTYAETAPVANYTGTPTSGNAPLNVQFTGTCTGTITTYAWDFTNDGTVDSTLQNPNYTYPASGTYSVKLNVTGPGGSNVKIRTDYITVSAAPVAPVANFTGTPTSGNTPLNVQFTDASTGTITSYAWDFTNDGTVDSTLQNPNYTYLTVGTYSVKLNVTGPGGSDAKVRTNYITVSAPPLIAAFNATPINGLAPLSVTFTDQSTGTITSRKWEYRSGSGSWNEFSTASNPTQVFATPGPYDIRLTVSNTEASDALTKTRYILVSGGPAPLTTIKSGTVSGDLYVGAFQPVAWGLQPSSGVTSRDFGQAFTIPSFTDIQWARLYVNVYSGSGGGNWPLRTIVSFDGNGDGSFESVLGIEDMDIQGAGDGNAYPLNDHCNRVYSDYNTWYDVTGLITATTPAAHVKTEQIPPGTYDGRLKTITLVVAYNDGDTDQVRYWVNAGHDYQGSSESGHQTVFATDLLPANSTSADLTNVQLASKDSAYTFNTVLYTGANPVAPVNFFGTNAWNVTPSALPGSNSTFTYTHAANTSYKTILAALKVLYPTPPAPIPPVANFTMNQTSGHHPLAVQFTDTSTGTAPLSHLWEFGDGITSTEQDPVHVYGSMGSYLVNLTVGNSAGSSTLAGAGPIVVTGSIGGDKGYYLVHCNVDGAAVYLDDSYKGLIENGTLTIQVYTTATPYWTYTVEKNGYLPFTAPITDHPGKGETVDLYAELVPVQAIPVILPDGWNIFSSPVQLDEAHDSWDQIFPGPAQEPLRQVLGWNGAWFIPQETDPVEPLDAYYIQVNGSVSGWLVPSLQATPPPSRDLPSGVCLIGPAPAYEQGIFPAMPLDQALISIDKAPGGKTGYTMVISPGLNQPAWAYARGGTVRDLLPFKGYWVVVENPDTLYGFSTTPIGFTPPP